MADQFEKDYRGRVTPPEKHLQITPNDGVNLADIPKALYIGGAGDIVVTDKYGTDITYAVSAGFILPFRPVRVKATGTTATNIVGWYD